MTGALLDLRFGLRMLAKSSARNDLRILWREPAGQIWRWQPQTAA